MNIADSQHEGVDSCFGFGVRRPASPSARRQRFVEVRSRFKQRFDCADVAFAHGKQERRKTAIRTGAHIRAMREQNADHIRVAF